MNPAHLKTLVSILVEENSYMLNGERTLDFDDLADYEKATFVDSLFEHDDAVQDFLGARMQTLINERLEELEFEHKNSPEFCERYRSHIDSTNGETIYTKRY